MRARKTLSALALWFALVSATAADEAFSLFNSGAASGVSASIGGLELPVNRMACASCHGRDGRGRTEGDAAAPAITRGVGGLDRAGVTPAGNIRPPYTLQTFRAALTDGITPDGRQLSPRMPRYHMDERTAGTLWTYLESLPIEQTRGVSASGLVFAITAPQAQMPQAEQLRALLQAKAEYLGGGRTRLRFEAEPFSPSGAGEPQCPGTNALAIVLPFVDTERRIFERARQCGVPVLFPLADLVGSENPLDVRGDRAPLLVQWKALVSAAGQDVTILMPPDLEDWETEALAFANIQERSGNSNVLFLPFGLNRTDPVRQVASVFAPAYGSAASLTRWQSRRHRLSLAVTAPSSLDQTVEELAAVLGRAAELAGPDVTRASFMEAIGRIANAGGGSGLNYATHRLTGRTEVRIERF